MKKINVLLILTLVILTYVGMSSSYTTEVRASSFNENDLAQFLTVTLDNVTVTIDPASSPNLNYKLVGTSSIFTLNSVKVTASTINYNRAEFEKENNIQSFHKVSETQVLQALELQQLSSYSQMSTLKILSTAAANDSSEAAGDNFLVNDGYKLSDFRATKQIETNQSHYTTWPTLETKYQYWANELSKNSTRDMFVTDATEEIKNGQLYVSEIANVEATMLRILRENVAANYSTVSDVIVPSRVHVLDYDFDEDSATAGILNLYMSETLQNKFREAADEYLAETITTRFKIFGVCVAESNFKNVAVSGLFDVFDDVIKVGQTILTAPLKIPDVVVDTLTAGYDAGIDIGAGVVNAGLSIPTVTSKAVGEGINTFTATTGLGANLGGTLGSAGKLASDSFSSVMGGVQGIFGSVMNILPFLLIFLGVGGIILLILYKKFMTSSPGNEGIWPY